MVNHVEMFLITIGELDKYMSNSRMNKDTRLTGEQIENILADNVARLTDKELDNLSLILANEMFNRDSNDDDIFNDFCN
jgi:hypothetical protein